jgi:putative ABC transport system ATP-binding protein
LIEALNVLQNIELCLYFGGMSRCECHLTAGQILKNFEIEHLANRYPRQLSQGEKQRVAIARSVANDAQLILADEPTASLESGQGFEIIRLLHDYACKEKKCVLVASHDLRLIDYADRIVKIENGRMVDDIKED